MYTHNYFIFIIIIFFSIKSIINVYVSDANLNI